MEINGIRLAKYYFEIVAPDSYDFSKREGKGYDAARKQIERLIKRGDFDRDAMKQAIEQYKKEAIEEHNILLNNLEKIFITI